MAIVRPHLFLLTSLFCLVLVCSLLHGVLVGMAHGGGGVYVILATSLLPFVHEGFWHWSINLVCLYVVVAYLARVIKPGFGSLWTVIVWSSSSFLVVLGHGVNPVDVPIGLSGHIGVAVGIGAFAAIAGGRKVAKKCGHVVFLSFALVSVLYALAATLEGKRLLEALLADRELTAYNPSFWIHFGSLISGLCLGIIGRRTLDCDTGNNSLADSAGVAALTIIILTPAFFRPWLPEWCLSHGDKLAAIGEHEAARKWYESGRRLGVDRSAYGYRVVHLAISSGDYRKAYNDLYSLPDLMQQNVMNNLSERGFYPRASIALGVVGEQSDMVACHFPNWPSLPVGLEVIVPLTVVGDRSVYQLRCSVRKYSETALEIIGEKGKYPVRSSGYSTVSISGFERTG